MKRYFLLFILLFPGSAKGQLSAGSRYLGGSILYTKTSGITGTEIDLTPAAIFLNSRLLLGLDLTYLSGNSTITDNTSYTIAYKYHSAGGGPFMRYYIPLSSRFYFAIETSLLALATKDVVSSFYFINGVRSSAITTTTSPTNVLIRVRPMLIYFPTKAWGLEAGIAAISDDYSFGNGPSENTFKITGTVLTIGSAWYFKR